MNHIDDGLPRLLDALAERADGHGPHDRVPAVRRRARQARLRRNGLVAGAALAALAVGVGLDALPFTNRAAPPPTRPPTLVVRTEGLTVDLRQDDAMSTILPNRQPGARAVVVVRVHGWVPRRSLDPSPSGREHLLALRILEDGRDDGELSRGSRLGDDTPCTAGAPLARVDDEYAFEARFPTAGTYTVTYETTACAPVGTVRRTITVVAR